MDVREILREILIKAYQDSHQIAEMLARRDSNNTDWQSDLSVSYNKLGDMHKANGGGDKAIKAYHDSFKIAETLARRDPNNSNWQCDLKVSYVKQSEVFPGQRKKYLQKARI